MMVYIFLFISGTTEYFLLKLFKRNYPWNEVSTALFTSTINSQIYRLLAPYIAYPIYVFFYSVRIFDFNTSSSIFLVFAFLTIDFGFYWLHRINHTVRLFWTAHQVHHYPNRLTILSSSSQSFVGMFINFHIVIFSALAFLGIPVKIFLYFYSINLLFQALLHNELIPRIKWFEYIFNTPSLHRIHHSLSKQDIGKNYGGVLSVFDLMFGTYCNRGSDDLVYGVVPIFKADSLTSTWAFELHGWRKLIADVRCQKTFYLKFKKAIEIDSNDVKIIETTSRKEAID